MLKKIEIYLIIQKDLFKKITILFALFIYFHTISITEILNWETRSDSNFSEYLHNIFIFLKTLLHRSKKYVK